MEGDLMVDNLQKMVYNLKFKKNSRQPKKREYNKNGIKTWKMTSSTTKKSTLIGCDIKVNVPSLSRYSLGIGRYPFGFYYVM
jgi:hypothetical protein